MFQFRMFPFLKTVVQDVLPPHRLARGKTRQLSPPTCQTGLSHGKMCLYNFVFFLMIFWKLFLSCDKQPHPCPDLGNCPLSAHLSLIVPITVVSQTLPVSCVGCVLHYCTGGAFYRLVLICTCLKLPPLNSSPPCLPALWFLWLIHSLLDSSVLLTCSSWTLTTVQLKRRKRQSIY